MSRLQSDSPPRILRRPSVVSAPCFNQNPPIMFNKTKKILVESAYKKFREGAKGRTLVKDTAIVFDEANKTIIMFKPSFPNKRAVPKYPHRHFLPSSFLNYYLFQEKRAFTTRQDCGKRKRNRESNKIVYL